MLRPKTTSADATWQDSAIANLETRLAIEPNDRQAIRRLITILDGREPSELGSGIYSNCQRKLAAEFQNETWIGDILNADETAKHYRNWQAVLDSMNVNPPIPISQIYSGRHHIIKGESAYCELRLSLFDKLEVISKICRDCYKVQILPTNLLAHIQTYFALRNLLLPRNNYRKCMIELREDVPYPYKGYIYCESEDEAHFSLSEFQKSLREHNISNVICGISHGCSEYGLKFPEFKYSKDGAHRSFERPASWDQIESDFLAVHQKPQRVVENHNKKEISVRDVIVFRTWIDYAEIIDDDCFRKFRDRPHDDKPEPFATRASKQSKLRKSQMEELQRRLSSEV